MNGRYPVIEAECLTLGRSGRLIDLVVLHSTQSGEHDGSACGVARWFQDERCRGSAHYVVDPGEVIQCVGEADQAWGAWGANKRGIHVELCGLAEQTPAQWEDDDSRRMIVRAAQLVADVCRRYDIPAAPVLIDDLRVQQGRGIITHADASTAFPGHGDHWDPGPGFPFSKFLQLVNFALKGGADVS